MALTKVDISLMDNIGTTANKLLAYDGSGNIPAVDGSQLINVATGILESTSDPTVSTNPSGGVGTQWNNKTSGEVYICTDATAGENVWKNVGAGSGNVFPYVFHGSGSNYGYAAGTAPGPYTDHIQKFSFTSASNATDVGNLTQGIGFCTGQSSTTHGYRSGGGYGNSNVIDKWTFSADANATDVGDLLSSLADGSGTSSETYGHHCGGYPATNVIQRFAFSTDGNATDHGDLAITHSSGAGMNSQTYGYVSGGNGGNRQRCKFAFASNTTAVDDGDHFAGHHTYVDGVSSETHGYVVGGAVSGAGSSNIIDKFAYASGGDSTDVGDLSQASYSGCGVSQTDYGYKGGGNGTTDNDRIEKWTFASDNNSVDTTANMLSINSGSQSHGYMGPAQY